VCFAEQIYATSVASIVNLFFVYGFGVPISKTSEAMCSQVARLLKEERAKAGFRSIWLPKKPGCRAKQ
jgi:hypothetical protein